MFVYSLASDDSGSSKLCQVLMHPLSHLHLTNYPEKTGLIALSLQMRVQRLQELLRVISAGDRAEPYPRAGLSGA